MHGKESFKFSFIGAGSCSFTTALVGDILQEDFIKGGELRLVDINPIALQLAYEAVVKMIESSNKHFKVTKHTDYRETLEGLDFILFTFVTGSFSSWKTDIDICTKHGVLQSVGDTIGPGGIIRAIRNVPVIYNIAKDMEEICPDAWAINYSNPEGAMALALEKYTKIKTFSLCHGTPDTVKKLADKVFHVDYSHMSYRAAGINHLTWITDLRIDGKDVYPILKNELVKSGFSKSEPISLELFNIFGLYPAPGDRHVEEFFPFYLKEDVLKEKNYEWKNNDIITVQRWRDESIDKFNKLRLGEMSYLEYGNSGETAMNFVKALSSDNTTIEMANVMNRGYIDNISDGIIVEIPNFVDQFGLHPQKIGNLPEAIAAKCEILGREYSLAVKAAIECDKTIAMQAMMLDPLVAHCNYPEKLLDELLAAYKDMLPVEWADQIKSN